MAIDLRKQPRHVLVGLAIKHWGKIRTSFRDDIARKGKKAARAISTKVLRHALRVNGIGA